MDSRCDARQARQRHRKFLFIVVLVDKFAFEEADVGLHIEMAVTGEVEENGLLFALFLAAQSFIDRAAYRVIGFRRRHDAFAARKFDTSFKAGLLMVCARLDQSELVNVRDER